MKWIGKGHFGGENDKVMYSGHEKKKTGVGIITKQVEKSPIGYKAVNDRIMYIRVEARPVNITWVQVYTPTTSVDEKNTEFYRILQSVLNEIPRKNVVILMGDWNAKTGKGEESETVGKYGLGNRNEAGERLLEFCEENALFLANTFFKQPEQRLYTWTSLNGKYKNQTDYIIGRRR
jgi:exonuclease III